MTRNPIFRNELVSTVHEHGINMHTREIYLHGHVGESEEEPSSDDSSDESSDSSPVDFHPSEHEQ